MPVETLVPPPITETLLTREQITDRVDELGQQIAQDYEGKELVIVGILTGSYIFVADLTRAINEHGKTDFEVDFMGISSYGFGTESSRQPRITKDLEIDVSGKHVLVAEDMVDTGYSFKTLLKMLSVRSAKSVKTCVLLSKPDRREVEVPIDYLGFEISDKWVEGYGLDTNQMGRGNPKIVVREAT